MDLVIRVVDVGVFVDMILLTFPRGALEAVNLDILVVYAERFIPSFALADTIELRSEFGHGAGHVAELWEFCTFFCHTGQPCHKVLP